MALYNEPAFYFSEQSRSLYNRDDFLMKVLFITISFFTFFEFPTAYKDYGDINFLLRSGFNNFLPFILMIMNGVIKTFFAFLLTTAILKFTTFVKLVKKQDEKLNEAVLYVGSSFIVFNWFESNFLKLETFKTSLTYMLTLLMLLVIYNDGIRFWTYVCSYRWNGTGLQDPSEENQNGHRSVPLEDPLNASIQISDSREAIQNDLHLVHLNLQSASISFNGDNQNVDDQDNFDQKDEVSVSARNSVSVLSKKQIVECKTRSGKVFSCVDINFSESKTRSGAVYRSPKNAKPSKTKNTPTKKKL